MISILFVVIEPISATQPARLGNLVTREFCFDNINIAQMRILTQAQKRKYAK